MPVAPNLPRLRWRLPYLAATALLAGLLPLPVAAETCEFTDFDAFLQAFSIDPALQEQASADPLPMSWIDMGADPEPAKVSQDMPHKDVQWPVILDLTADHPGFTTQIAAPDDDNRVVFVSGNDNGISEIYYFRATPCWTLMRVDSNST